MKPFLCIDISEDKSSEAVNGAEFISARPSEMMRGSLEGAAAAAVETQERAKLPAVLRVIQWICGMAGALVVLGIVRALKGDVSLPEAYSNAPAVFVVQNLRRGY